MADIIDLRRRLTTRVAEMELERSSWIEHWKECAQFVLPRSGRFLITDHNNGQKKHNKIYDSTATMALRVLGAGLMSGATSPARPWFRLATSDPDLMNSDAVKVWTSRVTQRILDMFARTNTYRSLHRLYEELGVFGTGATVVMDDFDKVLHHHVLTAGEYTLAQNWRGEVDTLSRQFEDTVENIVREFGLANCSQAVQTAYDRGNYGQWFPVTHIIEPRHDRDMDKRDNKNMPFRSIYFQTDGNSSHVLRESGMREFRALTPRWDVNSHDIYGSSPVMDTLGDIKQLQHQQLKKGTGIDYMVEPPLQIPTALKDQPHKRLPGGEYYVDATGPGQGVRTAFDVNIRLDHLTADIIDVRNRINEGMFKPLFLSLSSEAAIRGKLTATQVAEMHEEKLLMLGPVIERLHNELLQPLVEMAFTRLLEIGELPEPPEELMGQEINVQFVSILAQAQRAVGLNSIDRFVNTLGAVAQFKPGILDKLNEDELADRYSNDLGVDPALIVPDARVALIRKQRAQAQQQAQQAAQANMNADTVNKMANAPTDQDSALTNVMENLQGYSTPTASSQGR